MIALSGTSRLVTHANKAPDGIGYGTLAKGGSDLPYGFLVTA